MSAPAIWHTTFTATRQRTSTQLIRLPVSLSRILELLQENGEDDYGAIGPTQFAFWTAFKMVSDAISIVGEDFACSPAVDSEGGIRLSWRRGDRQVKLICPAKREAAGYIYQASPEGTSVRDRDVTAAALADRLSWLINRESSASAR